MRAGLCVAGVAGCSAVLGIEELGDQPPLNRSDSGAGGSGAGGGSSGGSNAGGASGSDAATGGSPMSSGGKGGGSSSGGKGGGGAGGVTTDGGGGVGGTGGGATGGAAGAGGGPADAGGPVKGTVIDYFRHKVANAIVTIGSTTVNTDANGAFTINGVSGTYDVALVVSYTAFGQVTDGWLFQGLTRKDPTLQVYQGLTLREGDAVTTIKNVTFPLTATQQIGYSFASPDGIYSDTQDSASLDVFQYDWRGTTTTTGSFHALLWTFSGTQSLPSVYTSYAVTPTTLNETTSANVTLSMAAVASTNQGNVSGTVTGSSANSRENDVYERFQDGAAIQLAHDYAPTSSFSYKVPSLTNGGVTVAAIDGSPGYQPVSIAYQDDIAVGKTGLTFDIPSVQSQLAPVDGATTVSTSTSFTWTGPAGISVFTIYIDPANSSNSMFVVTTQKTTKLPSFPDAAFTIPPNTPCTWFVEEHGTATTMDAAAGPTGYLDAFAYGSPKGPRRGTGTYTESVHRSFTTAP